MRVKVWDLPTRLFHWLLVLLVIGLVVSGKVGGDEWMAWHGRMGYCVLALVLFRVAWGFAGGHWSRFASFPPSLRRAWAYAGSRGGARPVGHTAVGALSIYAMLLFLALQAGTGLFSQTREDFAGPLAGLVSNAASHWITGYHRNVGQFVLIVLVLLHLVAVALYAMRGYRLTSAMLSGEKEVSTHTPASRDDGSSRGLALLILLGCAAVVAAIVKLGG